MEMMMSVNLLRMAGKLSRLLLWKVSLHRRRRLSSHLRYR